MTFPDRFGNPIDGCIEYSTHTGIAEDGPGGSGPMVKREKFHPDCIVVVDGQAKPDDTEMGNIREKHTGKRDREK